MNQSDSSVDQGVAPIPSSGLRKGILVLGMHRSGTSALTRVLHLLGCQLPTQLIGAGLGNELGHWESERIAAFNDEVLASAGSSWDDWLPFNPDWYQSPVFLDFVSRGRTLLREEFGSSSLFVLKDPRICRIAHLWLAIFAAEGIEPAVVLPVRNPIEVGNSLNERDMMDVGYAHLLWLRHILDAEISSRGLKRIFCTYDQLLDDWPTLVDRMKAVLGIRWPRVSAGVGVEISSFLTKEHRHYINSPKLAGSQISNWISETYGVAVRWSDSGETESDIRILDSIRSEFDAASPAFGHLLLPRSRSGAAGDGSRRRAALEQQLADAQARADAAEAGLESVRQELGVTHEREALAIDELQQKRDALKDLDQLDAKIANAESEIARLSDNERSLAERLAQSEALLSEKTARLDADTARIEELAAERDGLAHRLADVETTVHQRDGEIARLADSERSLAEKLAQSEALLSEKTAQLDADMARIEEFAAERNMLAHRLADVESTLRQREEEIAQTRSELETVRLAKSEMQTEFDQLAKDVERQSGQLEEERCWTLTLARDRQLAEQRAEVLESVLAKERASFEKRINEAHNEADQRISLRYSEIAELVGLLGSKENEIAQSKLRVDTQSAQIAELVELLSSREKEAAGKVKAADELQSEISKIREDNASANNAMADMHRRLISTEQQLSSRSASLSGQQSIAQKSAERIEWLKSVNQIMSGSAQGWYSFMPPGWRHKRALRSLQRKGLFDASAYLERYPDVAAAQMDALRHFISHGMLEGRSTGFD